MARLADIYKQESKTGGGVSSALGKRLAEKIDPRQIFDQSGLITAMFPSLKSYSAIKPSGGDSLKSKITPTAQLDSGALTDVAVATKMTAKNTMVLPAMARDMNLMRQNIAKVVKLQGGAAATKGDMFFMRAKERESIFESAFSKLRGKAGSVGLPGPLGGTKRDGQSKSTALYVETVGLSDTLLGALGGAAAGAVGGKLSGALAKALPFLASATLPILGIAGLAGLLYFLIKKDSGEAETVDKMEKGGGYTPEQGGRAEPTTPQASDEELKKVRESMRSSEDPAIRAAAAELDRRDAVKALPDESEAEKRRLGLSAPPEISTTPTPAITPTTESISSNVVVSGSGEAIRTGSGGYVTSGEPSTAPTPVVEQTTITQAPFPVISPSPAAPAESTSPTKAVTPAGTGPSDSLINFLKQKENPVLAKSKGTSKAFWDFKQYSIGYGTKANSPDEIINEAEADKRLRNELSKSYEFVASYAKQKGYNWDQGKMDALASFVYNLGPGQLKNLTNDGKRTDAEIARALPLYNKAGGKVLAGLEKRRTSELAMFTGGTESMTGAAPVLASSSEQTSYSPSSSAATAVTPAQTKGTAVAAASTAVAEGQRTSSGSSGSVVVDNSQRTTVASAASSGKPASAYDKDIVDALMSSSYA